MREAEKRVLAMAALPAGRRARLPTSMWRSSPMGVRRADSTGDARRAQRLDPEDENERWLALARKIYEVHGSKGEPCARDLAVEVAKLRDEDGGRDGLASWLDRLEAILRDAMVLGEAEGDDGSSAAPHLMNAAATKASASIASRLPPTKASRLSRRSSRCVMISRSTWARRSC